MREALREACEVDWAIEKWGGRPHYRAAAHVLGEDEHGTWMWGPAGRTIYRDDQPLFVAEQDTLILATAGRWWSPAWWIGHPELTVYVNVGTPPVWAPDAVTTVDLDLDVVQFSDGRVEVVDRDEFELHQREFGYPPDIVEAAERAAGEAFDLVLRGVAPFDGNTSQTWIEHARGLDFPLLATRPSSSPERG
jgi:protein associated with RNAse G/E